MRKSGPAGAVLTAVAVCAAVATAQNAAPPKGETPDAVYERFNQFCIRRFGAEIEPLIYDKVGKKLAILKGGDWRHVSETSAVIGFETNLPAKGVVEFGEAAKYGRTTRGEERHFYLHVHYLTGLRAATTYHYRLVAVDERGNRLATQDATFTTKKLADAVRIPGGLPGPPWVLDKPGATYLVTRDLTCDGSAFRVTGADITLDLGGHTVVYDNKHLGKIDGNFHVWLAKSSLGVRATNAPGLKLLNGTIRQGAGNDWAYSYSIGYNPVYATGCAGMELAGVTVRYSADQMVGVYNHWGVSDATFHHNVFLDTGAEVNNRHGAGCSALLLFGEQGGPKKINTHHNLVKRTRHMGLAGTQVHHNEIYIDSCATNSFGVRSYAGHVHHNRVLATGWGAQAFGWSEKGTWHDNFVHMQGCKPEGRIVRVSLVGMRVTQYNGAKRRREDCLYHDNLIVGTARGGSSVRGTWFYSDPYVKNLVFRDNVVKVTVEDQDVITGAYKEMACVVTQGLPDRTEKHLPIVYKDNTFISNICNVRFGDYYGIGSNHRFHNCKFVKIGNDPRYKTFWWRTASGYPSKNHVFRDCVFEGGASLDSMTPFGSGERGFTVQWTLTVRTAPGADVTVADKTGKVVFSAKADEKGRASAPLSQYLITAGGKTFFTPHTVKADQGGRHAEKTVTVDRKRDIVLKL